jgi:L-ascorbate metabolism protein UlaG (beta-lactamase superfamily)
MYMKVTKLGHCCLIVEIGATRILTDPGNFTSGYESVVDIDIVLITHEHADHLHVPALLQVLAQSPGAVVFANSSVGKLLTEAGISYQLLEGVAETKCGEVTLIAHDAQHEEIYEELGQVQNTGYFIGGELFYPGDAFAVPPYHVPVLALPVAGPWCKVADAVRYALQMKPEKVFPVHDGMLLTERIGSVHAVPKKILAEAGIAFTPLREGESAEF